LCWQVIMCESTNIFALSFHSTNHAHHPVHLPERTLHLNITWTVHRLTMSLPWFTLLFCLRLICFHLFKKIWKISKWQYSCILTKCWTVMNVSLKKKKMVCCTCSFNDITVVCNAAAKENHDKPQLVKSVLAKKII